MSNFEIPPSADFEVVWYSNTSQSCWSYSIDSGISVRIISKDVLVTPEILWVLEYLLSTKTISVFNGTSESVVIESPFLVIV